MTLPAITHRRDEPWGLRGLGWNQPNATFTHRYEWHQWCPYCRANLRPLWEDQ